MFGGDEEGVLDSGGDKSPPGQVIGFTKKATRTLKDSGNGRIIEGVSFEAGQEQMVSEILFHFLTRDPFEMKAGQDAGSQRMGSAEDELIDQGTLTGQDDGEIRFGVLVELGQSVEFGKDLQTQEGGLINNQDGFYFFAFIEVTDFFLD